MSGAAVWGLHMGMTHGLLSARVSDEASQHLRATAFGEFNFASGIAVLPANRRLPVGADRPVCSVIAGAAFSALGLSALTVTRRVNHVA